MKEIHYFYVPNAGTDDTLPDDEAQHALRVLRLTEGDELHLMDGIGNFYRAEVSLATNHKCCYRIIETMPQQRPWRGHICVALAPTKMMDRTEWFVEKAVEIGVDEIVFLNCRFSERREIKMQRIEKICISAVKQSRKAWMPKLVPVTDFRKFVPSASYTRKYIAHCYDEIPKKNFLSLLGVTDGCPVRATDDTLCIMIGPEGDFSIDEVQHAIDNKFLSVSLGESRLRTETAGIVAADMMHIAMTL